MNENRIGALQLKGEDAIRFVNSFYRQKHLFPNSKGYHSIHNTIFNASKQQSIYYSLHLLVLFPSFSVQFMIKYNYSKFKVEGAAYEKETQ